MITIIGKPYCGNCEKAKMKFMMKGIDFSYKDVTIDNELRDFVMGLPRQELPVVKMNGEVLIGYDAICEYLEK